MIPSSQFRLQVTQVDQTCLFELSWGKGQRLHCRVSYPATLTTLYHTWQQAYLNFYRSQALSGLRGRVQGSGTLVSPPIDWRAKLVEAEAKLLYEFHYWLNSADLLEIRREIAKAAQEQATHEASNVEVFLTCDPIDLDRFPWEAWEIGTEFSITKSIRLVRAPATIRAEAARTLRQGRMRVLVILGDDTGLDFQQEQLALKSLERLAEVRLVGWQAGKEMSGLKLQIQTAIADPQGWDILFFAGHSNETALTGGELGIAPGESLFIQEITPQLKQAKERGLQFALFNSCNGLSIAHRLIDLGFSQVAIMREPIHNQVAQLFLSRFLQAISQHQDVHDALIFACQELRGVTYPSAHLIPSLFRHPESVLLQLQPQGWRQYLRAWLPTRRQMVVTPILLGLSLLWPIQSLMLDTRMWVQAMYRQATGQIPVAAPPVLLVHIDQDSIRAANLPANSLEPLDRRYLAQLVNQAQKVQPTAIGIDYFVEERTAEDSALKQAVDTAVQKQIWITFALDSDLNGEAARNTTQYGLSPTVARSHSALLGYIEMHHWYLELPTTPTSCHASAETCPFAYLLALSHSLKASNSLQKSVISKNDSQQNLRTQIFEYLTKSSTSNRTINQLKQTSLSSITRLSQRFDQLWLKPILDFSLPPDRIYHRIPAVDFLQQDFSKTQSPSIVLIASGGYRLPGETEIPDTYPLPKAVAYWQHQANSTQAPIDSFTGGQALAYSVHHHLNHWLIIPIPDLWMMGMAIVLGKLLAFKLGFKSGHSRHSIVVMIVGNLLYIGVGLQIYVAGLLLPWVLPSMIFWVYVLPGFSKESHA